MSVGRAALLALVAGSVARGEGGDAAHERALAALPRILADVGSPDPETRLRARRLAKRVALDCYEAATPEGMRFVRGPIAATSHGIRSEGFYLGEREVTRGEFREFARERRLPDRWAEGDPDLPVTDVSLEEARAYAEARGARLPTLEELDRAARGGGLLRYPWGGRFEPARVNSREAGRGGPEPASSRPGGVSVHGVAHLLGNVAEWTETPAGRHTFAVAGGSYRGLARHGRTYRLEPSARLPDVGFRLAKSLPPLLTPAPE